MSNEFLNSVDKVLHLERLGDKLVAASIACLLDTVLKGVGAKCQNGRGGINFLDDAGGVETVHLGHTYVHQDQVGMLFLVEGHCFNAVASTEQAIAIVEHALYEFIVTFLVLCHQDELHLADIQIRFCPEGARDGEAWLGGGVVASVRSVEGEGECECGTDAKL